MEGLEHSKYVGMLILNHSPHITSIPKIEKHLTSSNGRGA